MTSGELRSEKTIYFRSKEMVNEIYHKLGEVLNNTCGSADLDEEIVISTRSGDYYLPAKYAEEKFAELIEMDRSDNLQRQVDGKIQGIYLYQLFKDKSEKRSTDIRYGVSLDFDKFIPSAAWLINMEFLENEAAKGQITLIHFDETEIRNHDDMWMIVTETTNAGVSPDTFKLASCLCNSGNNCSVKSYIKEGTSIASSENPQSHHLAIRWSLVERRNVEVTRYLFFHEFLHKIYAKVARENRLARFGLYVSNLAKLSGDERKMRAADEYFRYYRDYCEIPYLASGKTDRTAQMRFKYITYTVEEAVEPELIKIMAPEFLEQAIWNGREIFEKSRSWTVEDFAAYLRKDDLYRSVAGEASHIYHAALLGVDVSDWRNKVEKAIENEPKAKEIFNFMFVMFEVAKDYVNSPEFKARYIDTAERPFRCE